MVSGRKRSLRYSQVQAKPSSCSAMSSRRSNFAVRFSGSRKEIWRGAAPASGGRPPVRGSAAGCLQHEHHLKQRRVAHAPGRVELFHQVFEGNVLMGVRLQRVLLHLFEELRERHFAPGVARCTRVLTKNRRDFRSADGCGWRSECRPPDRSGRCTGATGGETPPAGT